MSKMLRRQIADEVRATSMMNLKERATSPDVREMCHLRDGGRYLLDGRKRKRLERLGWISLSDMGGFKVTTSGLMEIAYYLKEADHG